MKELKSALEKVIQEAWGEKDMDKSKKLVLDFVLPSKIKEEDKKRMEVALGEIKTKRKLDYYLANALLKFEGSGLSQLNKNKL